MRTEMKRREAGEKVTASRTYLEPGLDWVSLRVGPR
jgi:hypothetical protein